MNILVNGEPSDVIAVNDRGLLYGDGLFETFRVREGEVEFWDEHIQRLLEGCRRLKILPPSISLLQQDRDVLVSDSTSGVLKIIVTRGEGARGYRPPLESSSSRITQLSSGPHFPQCYCTAGIALTVCETRLANNSMLAGLKHLNRLEQVMGRAEWDDEFQEGLMCDTTGNVIEGTMSNVFIIENDRVITPPIDHCGVKGIVRDWVMRICSELKIDCLERKISIDQVLSSDDVFVCNSVVGIWPVASLNSHTFKRSVIVESLLEEWGKRK